MDLFLAFSNGFDIQIFFKQWNTFAGISFYILSTLAMTIYHLDNTTIDTFSLNLLGLLFIIFSPEFVRYGICPKKKCKGSSSALKYQGIDIH